MVICKSLFTRSGFQRSSRQYQSTLYPSIHRRDHPSTCPFLYSVKKDTFSSWQTWFGHEKMRRSSAWADPWSPLLKFFHNAIMVFLTWSSAPAVQVAIASIPIKNTLVNFRVCNISASDDSVAFRFAPPLWIFTNRCPVLCERAGCRNIISRGNLCSHICDTSLLRSSQSRTSFKFYLNDDNFTDRFTVDWIKTDSEISTLVQRKKQKELVAASLFENYKDRISVGEFLIRWYILTLLDFMQKCSISFQMFQRQIRGEIAYFTRR